MGFFNNLLPVQLRVDRTQSATSFASEIKQELLNVFSHQEVPFERLAEEPALAARAQRGGIYQALFSFQDARDRVRQWGPLVQSSILVFQKGATEDLGLWLMEVPSGLEGGLIYNADLFSQDTALGFRNSYLTAVRNLVEQPSQTISQVVDIQSSASAQYVMHARSEESRVVTGSDNSVLGRRAPSTAPLGGMAGAIALVWSELMQVDVRLLRDTDNLKNLGVAHPIALTAAQRSATLLGFAMDPERYATQTIRQLAVAAEALSGPAPAMAPSDQPNVSSSHERELQRIWSELLDIEPDQITGDDNFFDLGGSSLLAMRAIELSARSLGFRVDARRYLSDSMSQLASEPVEVGRAIDVARRTVP